MQVNPSNSHTKPLQFSFNLTSLPLTFKAEQREVGRIAMLDVQYLSKADFHLFFQAVLESSYLPNRAGGLLTLSIPDQKFSIFTGNLLKTKSIVLIIKIQDMTNC